MNSDIYLIISTAGMSSSIPDQLNQILSVVTDALKGVSSTHRSAIQRQIKYQEHLDEQRIQAEHKRRAIREGTWHDGRLDVIAGNGVMSELGIGDERFGEDVIIRVPEDQLQEKPSVEEEQALRRKNTQEDMEAINSLPIVVIRNYSPTAGSAAKEEMLGVLAQWAATLAENQVGKSFSV